MAAAISMIDPSAKPVAFERYDAQHRNSALSQSPEISA